MSVNINENQDFLSRIYPLVSLLVDEQYHEERVGGSFLEEYFEKILSSDVKIVQIRAKNLELSFVKEQIIKYMKIKNKLNPGVKLIVNDYVELAEIADGVHLGQDDCPVHDARKKLGKDKIIGLSTHNLEQIKNAPQEVLNYLAIGPVFKSKTKSGHEKIVGIEPLREMKKRCSIPLVAIGGIDSINAKQVYATGIDSVAVISDILDAKDPKTQIAKYSL